MTDEASELLAEIKASLDHVSPVLGVLGPTVLHLAQAVVAQNAVLVSLIESLDDQAYLSADAVRQAAIRRVRRTLRSEEIVERVDTLLSAQP